MTNETCFIDIPSQVEARRGDSPKPMIDVAPVHVEEAGKGGSKVAMCATDFCGVLVLCDTA